jgi:multiple sugar transport system ATP-binding protein
MTLADRIVVMERGIVQQVGPPLELYRKPTNHFVAGFIGSPGMNFVDSVNDEGVLRGKGFSGPLGNRLAGLPHTIVTGIRPQDIVITPDSDALPLKGTVDVVEPMGAETYVHLRVDDQVILTRVPPDASARVGEPFTVYLPRTKLYLFDQDGTALAHGIS